MALLFNIPDVRIQPFIIAFSCFILSLTSSGQIHCGAVNFEPNTAITADFIFDSFSQYQAGITVNNIGKLRIRVEDQAIPDPDCRWFLTMEVNNNPGGGTAVSKWETLGTYGTGTVSPDIDIMEIRVRNACATSPIDGTFQTFSNNGDITDIIADLLPRQNAGTCTDNVNGPGNYLSNYNEYVFTIDLKVNPGFAFSPGIYQLSIRFHLEEQM